MATAITIATPVRRPRRRRSGAAATGVPRWLAALRRRIGRAAARPVVAAAPPIRAVHAARAAHAAHAADAAHAGPGAPPAVDPEETVYGCGWFDSSLDLREGLSIQEHAQARQALGALAIELPLEVWLAWHERLDAPGGPGLHGVPDVPDGPDGPEGRDAGPSSGVIGAA